MALEVNVHVDLYINGSFREILDVYGSGLRIINPISIMEIENKSVSTWKSNGYPVSYAYSGTLLAKISKLESDSIGINLYMLGFSKSYTCGGTVYYRLPISDKGKFSLY